MTMADATRIAFGYLAGLSSPSATDTTATFMSSPRSRISRISGTSYLIPYFALEVLAGVGVGDAGELFGRPGGDVAQLSRRIRSFGDLVRWAEWMQPIFGRT